MTHELDRQDEVGRLITRQNVAFAIGGLGAASAALWGVYKVLHKRSTERASANDLIAVNAALAANSFRGFSQQEVNQFTAVVHAVGMIQPHELPIHLSDHNFTADRAQSATEDLTVDSPLFDRLKILAEDGQQSIYVVPSIALQQMIRAGLDDHEMLRGYMAEFELGDR